MLARHNGGIQAYMVGASELSKKQLGTYEQGLSVSLVYQYICHRSVDGSVKRRIESLEDVKQCSG